MKRTVLVLDDAGTDPDAKRTIPPPQVRTPSRCRQAAAMEGSTIAEGGREIWLSGTLDEDGGEKCHSFPYELDGTI